MMTLNWTRRSPLEVERIQAWMQEEWWGRAGSPPEMSYGVTSNEDFILDQHRTMTAW